MKKTYSGLEAIKVNLDAKDQICASTPSTCFATVLLVMENYICITEEEFRQVEYYGDSE